MKKKLCMLLIPLFSIGIFSIRSSAQTVPGGGGEFDFTFKVNNSNSIAWGSNAEIKVLFTPMPDPNHLPVLTEIIFDDGKSKYQVTSVVTPVYGYMAGKTQPYITYRLDGIMPGNSQGNISPAIKLKLVFEVQ